MTENLLTADHITKAWNNPGQDRTSEDTHPLTHTPWYRMTEADQKELTRFARHVYDMGWADGYNRKATEFTKAPAPTPPPEFAEDPAAAPEPVKVTHTVQAHTGDTIEGLAATLDALNKAGAPLDAPVTVNRQTGITFAKWTTEGDR